MFYAASVLIAIGTSTTATTLLMALVGNWFRKRMGLAMGITASGVALGGLMVPLLTIVIDTFGWRPAMALLGLGMWAIPLPLALLLRHRPEPYGYLPDGREVKVVSDSDHDIPVQQIEISMGTREALVSGSFWIISLAFLCQLLLLGAVLTHIMPYLTTIGIQRSTSGFIAAALPLMSIVGRVGCGWIGDRVEKKKVSALSFALTSLGVFVLAQPAVGRNWAIVGFIVLFGIGWGGGIPMMTALLSERFGQRRLGTIVGFAGSLMMVGIVTGAPLAGWVYDTWGSYQPVWFFLAGLEGLATVLFYAFLRKAE
jgi:MFS family permease